MANFGVRVGRDRRLRRNELAYFLEAVGYQLVVGSDFSQAWRVASEALGSEMPAGHAGLLSLSSDRGMRHHLSDLSNAHPLSEYRYWFSILEELYGAGAPMKDAVLAFAGLLRADQARDLEKHVRTLPTRVNLLLILFFLPPSLLLMLLPVLGEISASLLR